MTEIQAGLIVPVPALARCLEYATTPQPGHGAAVRTLRGQIDGERVPLGLGASPLRALALKTAGPRAWAAPEPQACESA